MVSHNTNTLDVKHIHVKIVIGKGSGHSATIGAITVASLAKKLHKPKAVAETYALNILAVTM